MQNTRLHAPRPFSHLLLTGNLFIIYSNHLAWGSSFAYFLFSVPGNAIYVGNFTLYYY